MLLFLSVYCTWSWTILFKLDCYAEAKWGEPKFTWTPVLCWIALLKMLRVSTSGLFKRWHPIRHFTHLWCIHSLHCIVIMPRNSSWDQGSNVLSTVLMPKQKILCLLAYNLNRQADKGQEKKWIHRDKMIQSASHRRTKAKVEIGTHNC